MANPSYNPLFNDPHAVYYYNPSKFPSIFFTAFLAILENENAIRVWRGDNDTTSVITHILQKYHEEKHVMGINQFYVNRW